MVQTEIEQSSCKKTCPLPKKIIWVTQKRFVFDFVQHVSVFLISVFFPEPTLASRKKKNRKKNLVFQHFFDFNANN